GKLMEKAWRELVEGLGHVFGPEGRSITGLSYDSRRVEKGHLFFALPGQKTDGHRFIPEALAKGAAALAIEEGKPFPQDVPVLVTPQVRRAMAYVAHRFYDKPAEKLLLVGVTGTNGKTTTAHMIREMLATQVKTGLLGTLYALIGEERRPLPHTTPEAPDIERLLWEMVQEGHGACVMEASSEGIAQERVTALSFGAAAFTNLTQDHLNFHGTMENYYQAKARLFHEMLVGPAAIMVDDSWGERLAKEVTRPVITASAAGRKAHVRALEIQETMETIAFTLEVGELPQGLGTLWSGRRFAVTIPLGGSFTVANGTLALATAAALNVPPEKALWALSRLKPVPGRWELIQEGQPFSVVVDYAHTPAGLESLLAAARKTLAGKLICVFGAGGDRDREKRPLMGREGARVADVVIITSDNPRSEDPRAIIEEVARGAEELARERRIPLYKEEDRKKAIALALQLAEPGDGVVVAGKGHETTQTIGNQVLSFDDRQVVRSLLREMGYRG
ncbi:MAG: UDP-N-acetylmuramoyl-L-alanyl-D-glutamate--2,6-diaminopimelate ligase, partial [Bacillota bacterium]|nr:UDP-N-acetylmuramoyl-L-alanyl-D-glutamate--2,6-diaminopimelate ligase [Bacillota bacterium]